MTRYPLGSNLHYLYSYFIGKEIHLTTVIVTLCVILANLYTQLWNKENEQNKIYVF